MKRTKSIFYLALVLIGVSMMVISCGHPDNIQSGEKIYNEVKNAGEIFGLFDLKLGVTTIKDLERHYYKSPDYIYGKLEPDYHLGTYKLNIDDYNERDLPEKNLIKNQRVKQYYLSDYKFNGLSVDGLSLFFLDNKLIGIHVAFPSMSKGFNLVEDFKKKYGDGIGKESWHYVSTWDSKIKDYSFDKYFSYHTEERVWKNSIIEVKYNRDDVVYTLIEGYSKFDSLMKEAISEEMKKYNEAKSKEIKSSI